MGTRPSDLPLTVLLSQVAERAECRHDPDLHTGPDSFEVEPPAERLARLDAAREVCRSCPVWDLCLDYAVRARPAHGVWAGLLPRELAGLRRAVRRPEAA
ncbi:hypothetical protein Acsp03_27540 [Actinomadura sp. NBRC 104412]|uniref:WhiB family transcriptional regulator n=1 Tax=Actinomadura sp. NBRC 104412 TaxID=3032203 RepID=UPI0024A183B4|nr:WhiB family transcriptional regulator [Actinomadura sp. NBRC 104412]GLZ05288.1 hypothetical protein Acsp03_27540 [Actinomadura sp. NBRC 104412]